MQHDSRGAPVLASKHGNDQRAPQHRSSGAQPQGHQGGAGRSILPGCPYSRCCLPSTGVSKRVMQPGPHVTCALAHLPEPRRPGSSKAARDCEGAEHDAGRPHLHASSRWPPPTHSNHSEGARPALSAHPHGRAVSPGPPTPRCLQCGPGRLQHMPPRQQVHESQARCGAGAWTGGPGRPSPEAESRRPGHCTIAAGLAGRGEQERTARGSLVLQGWAEVIRAILLAAEACTSRRASWRCVLLCLGLPVKGMLAADLESGRVPARRDR